MRNLISGLVVGLIVGMLLAFVGTSPNVPQVGIDDTGSKNLPKIWRLVTLFPTSMYPIGPSTTQFVEKVNVLTKGTIEVKLFEPEDLVPALDTFNAVSKGIIEAALTSPSFWGDKSRGFELLGGFPFSPKIGEFLASGRPVVVNPGLVDAAGLLERHACGVVYGSSSSFGVGEVVDQLEQLLADPGTPERCRSLAEAHFSLDRGVNQLVATYESVRGSR